MRYIQLTSINSERLFIRNPFSIDAIFETKIAGKVTHTELSIVGRIIRVKESPEEILSLLQKNEYKP